MRSIYLDYSTTTPIAESVRKSMLPFLTEFYGHPASCHWYGRAAQEAIEDARSHLGSLLGCHPSEVTFSSGGTESVNLGLLGVARAISRSEDNVTPHLIISSLEHACVRMCADQLQREGWDLTIVPCDANAVVQVDRLQREIRKETRLMSIIHVSHRIGTIQPIAEIAALCQERDILFHTDAAQSVGKIETNVDNLGVDLLSLSGHKMYAPKGVGALYVRMGVPIEPLMLGEASEGGVRAGTPNVPGIVGLGQAAKLARDGMQGPVDRLEQFRDRFHAQLESLLGKPVPIYGEMAERVAGILAIELPDIAAEELQRQLPEICFGPTVRSSGAVQDRKHVNFGPTEQQSANMLRLSFGWNTSDEELQQALHLIASAYESLRP